MADNQDITKKRKFRFLSVFAKIGKSFKKFIFRFKDGSLGTKLSHFIMGAGSFFHKQIIKGILFLILQLGFLALMIFSPQVNDTPFGFKAIINFFTLGTEAGSIFTPTDNSMLMLLFGVITFGVIGLFFATYFANIRSAYKADLDLREGKTPTSFKEDIRQLLDTRFHIAMLTPSIIGIITFTVLPTIFMILIAFTNYDSLHPAGQVLFDWVGFDNFIAIFNGTGEISVRFAPVLGWTLLWAFSATATCYIGGILLALLINKKGIKGKKIWRTIFILTIALPQFISLLAMRNLLGEFGPVNNMLMTIGLTDAPIKFLSTADSAWTARITIIVINIWIGIPYTMLMTSGILMNVPKDLYEAAQIDGATKRQAFRHITVPYILFVTAPYLITSFVGNITSFNVIYLLTGGGPTVPGYIAGETDLLVTWLYKLTIDEAEYNIGSVIAIMTFIITATATLLSYRRSKSYKEEDAFQ
ncbi:carbohydrate ABC transporter permease [Candidatus Izemoplasma sp. B36]|uniref:carbohydrate ABC transporter permease n=1 Tax=Candidatus Izemoplasma sp. B36 TaxID=3242468 RepID=UPI003558000A